MAEPPLELHVELDLIEGNVSGSLHHHLDTSLLRLGESFHTDGFFKRESSLFNQLAGSAGVPAGRSAGRARRRG